MGPFNGAAQDVLESGDRRTPGARELIADALSNCREALTSELEAHYGRISGKRDGEMDRTANGKMNGKMNGRSMEPWCQPVIAFALLAAQNAVPPERALAAFKSMVIALAPVQRLPIDERNDLVHACVQVAIEAYYG